MELIRNREGRLELSGIWKQGNNVSGPRESQTRSSDYLKKSSMNQHAQQISATSELDLPQSGSEDEDEAWPTEGTNERIQAAKQRMFPQHPKTTLSADPVLLRTQFPALSANANECDLPGPLSRDDDEDSSPLVQDLDLEDNTSCSKRDVTTYGQTNNTLTHSGSLFGNPTSGVTPASPITERKDPHGSAKLTATSQKSVQQNAKLT